MSHKTFQTFSENKFVWVNQEFESAQKIENLKQVNPAQEKNETIKKLNDVSSKLGDLEEQLEQLRVKKTKDKQGEQANQLKFEKAQLDSQYSKLTQEIQGKYNENENALALKTSEILRKFEAKSSEKISANEASEDYQEAVVANLVNLSDKLKTAPITSDDLKTIENSIEVLFSDKNEVVGPQELKAMQDAIKLMRLRVSENYNQIDNQNGEYQLKENLKKQITDAGDEAVKKANDALPKEPKEYLRFIDADYYTTNSAIDFGYDPSTEKINIRVGKNWKEKDFQNELREKGLNSPNNVDFVNKLQAINNNDLSGAKRQTELAKMLRELAKNANDCFIEDKNGTNLWGDTWSIGNKETPDQNNAITAYLDKPVDLNLDEIREKAMNAKRAELEKNQNNKDLLNKEIVKPEELKLEEIQIEQSQNQQNQNQEKTQEKTTEKSEYMHKNIPGTQAEFDAMIKEKYGDGMRAKAMKAIVDIMARYIGIPKIKRTEEGKLVMSWFGTPEMGAQNSTETAFGNLKLEEIKDEGLRDKTKNFLKNAKDILTKNSDDPDFNKDGFIKNISEAITKIKMNALSKIDAAKQSDFWKKYLDKADETSFENYLKQA